LRYLAWKLRYVALELRHSEAESRHWMEGLMIWIGLKTAFTRHRGCLWKWWAGNRAIWWRNMCT